MARKIAVIGAGFAGLSAACCLAKEGHNVTVYEKNEIPGGRARKFVANGFTFDMGPSWYWMPDVFERFFNHFNKSTANYYNLKRLDPSYRVFYAPDDHLDIPAKMEGIFDLFETLEPGSSVQLRKFLREAAYKYDLGINELVYKPGRSLTELLSFKVLKGLTRLHVFTPISAYIRKYFKHPRLIQLLEFPVLFLGAMPSQTPALYSLMNYADISLGTWYPEGGMYKIIEAMMALAEELGVAFKFNSPVEQILTDGKHAKGIKTKAGETAYDYVIGGADYAHVEQELLPESCRKYTPDYWDRREMAPSCLIFYLGVNKQLTTLQHHNLFFDESFDDHVKQLYTDPQWPDKPLFYVCCPSKTDPDCAPAGHENVFVLIPVAPGLTDREEVRERYYHHILERLERVTGETILDHVVYKRSYAHNDFKKDYHAYKGNAYGLANTLRQTANLKPSMHSKVKNLFFTGQLTVPGPGVPPSIISGQVVARELTRIIR